VIRDGILRVYGSNFITLVKERKYAPTESMKGLILMFTRSNCPQCDWTEAYFDRLAAEFGEEDFQFAIMDVDQNSPTADVKQFLMNPDEPMLQFLAVLPDGGRINRFQKENDTYEDLQSFVQNIKYLVVHYKKEHGFYKSEITPPEEEEVTTDEVTENSSEEQHEEL
jgi:thiol-disulfide isomerase/thioredoxin